MKLQSGGVRAGELLLIHRCCVPSVLTVDGCCEQEKMMASQEIEMPQYNIRIQIPHDADDDSGDDDLEEDDQEDVPDRDQVKKYSSLMLEKANKKQKRQRKRKV